MALYEIRNGELVYMRSGIIKARHMFSTRFGGVSTGDCDSLNLGFNRGDLRENVMENYARVCREMGTDLNHCALTCQVHGNTVREMTSADVHEWGTDIPYEADGIVTREKNLPLFCFSADCVPVLLCDEKHGVIAAVHSGWRGTAADITVKAVEKMCGMGASKEDIMIAMGPAIGGCCFETDDDVPDAITKLLAGDTEGLIEKRPNGKSYVDLRGAIKRRLVQTGVPAENIDVSEECTSCSHDKYWSHRYTHGKRGTQCAVIMLEE